MPDVTPLAEMVDCVERVVAASPADVTSVAWIETDESEVAEGARTGRDVTANRRSVVLRVRVGGRTGHARAEASTPGELERGVRTALADARCQAPSPDWDLSAAERDPAALGGLADPAIVALDTRTAQQRLKPLAQRRSTLGLRWGQRRVAIAGSFHPTRSASLTEATFVARSGRQPGSGFVARSARRLAELDLDRLIDEARALEAPVTDQTPPAAESPAWLAPEATAVLLDALARHAFNGGRRLAGGKAPDLRLAEALRVVDEPLDAAGLPVPFDFDGCAKRPRVFVERGLVVSAATDLELAARLALEPTAHALAGDDAWPEHLALTPGEVDDAGLLAAAAGGIRIGSLDRLTIEPGDAMPFRALARNIRRITADGRLGPALAPSVWSGTLRDLLADVRAIGALAISWTPRVGSSGAVQTPAIVLDSTGELTPRAL